MNEGMENLKEIQDLEEKLRLKNEDPLIRIADALEEILRLVKKDQEETRARFEERWDKEDQEAAQ